MSENVQKSGPTKQPKKPTWASKVKSSMKLAVETIIFSSDSFSSQTDALVDFKYGKKAFEKENYTAAIDLLIPAGYAFLREGSIEKLWADRYEEHGKNGASLKQLRRSKTAFDNAVFAFEMLATACEKTKRTQDAEDARTTVERIKTAITRITDKIKEFESSGAALASA